MISTGDALPDFELTDADGNTFSSADLAGKKCAIYFYPKDFTPGCTTQADEFTREHAKFKKAGIVIVGISPDDETSHKKFCAKMGIPYTLLADTGHKVASMFGVWGKKKFMGREYMGVNRTTFLVGADGVILDVLQKVKPAGHAEHVLGLFAAGRKR